MVLDYKGTFITLEGIDGSGKTLQAKKLEEYLQSQGQKTLLTREPGGTEIGETVRDLLLKKTETNMHAHTELLLFNAARSEIVSKVVLPALKEGVYVICDRFYDSTFAYQGARGIYRSIIEQAVNIGSLGLTPDITFLFDLPLEEAQRRIGQRGGKNTRFDDESLNYQRNVQTFFQRQQFREPRRIKLINADRSIDSIHQEVISYIKPFFQL